MGARKGKETMAGMVTISENICKGCGLCGAVCPKQAMTINYGKLTEKGYNPAMVVDTQSCVACGMCAMMCPDSAIKVERG